LDDDDDDDDDTRDDVNDTKRWIETKKALILFRFSCSCSPKAIKSLTDRRLCGINSVHLSQRFGLPEYNTPVLHGGNTGLQSLKCQV